MNCIPWVNTAARAQPTRTHRILKPSQACRCAWARRARWWRGWTVEARFALVPSPRSKRKHTTHTARTVRTHALSRPHTPTQPAYPLSTHAQTFTQVPPGFDGWSVSALPPVSYTYNLIWGPHGASRTKTGLIEAVKLSYPSPPQVRSIIFRCLGNMYDCTLLIKSYFYWIKPKKRANTKLLDALFIADNSYFVLCSQEISARLNILVDSQYKRGRSKPGGCWGRVWSLKSERTGAYLSLPQKKKKEKVIINLTPGWRWCLLNVLQLHQWTC